MRKPQTINPRFRYPGVRSFQLTRNESDLRRATRFWAALLLLGLSPVSAQEIGKLYASRPPAGFAFIRIVTSGDVKAATKLEVNGVGLAVAEADTASRYRALPTDKPVRISIGGTAIPEGVKLAPNRFYTVLISREGGNWARYPIDESLQDANDLKAHLRFFNLMSNCEATLKIIDGPIIFDAAAVRSMKSRVVNPVETTLEATCGSGHTSFKLHQLRSGDHYSVFLREVGDGRTGLTGQFDETEPFQSR